MSSKYRSSGIVLVILFLHPNSNPSVCAWEGRGGEGGMGGESPVISTTWLKKGKGKKKKKNIGRIGSTNTIIVKNVTKSLSAKFSRRQDI